MSIQSSIVWVHQMRHCNYEKLATSVLEAWGKELNIQAFTKFYDRLQVVLKCILADKEGNELVESNCRKLKLESDNDIQNTQVESINMDEYLNNYKDKGSISSV